jgi:hypothetical protein
MLFGAQLFGQIEEQSFTDCVSLSWRCSEMHFILKFSYAILQRRLPDGLKTIVESGGSPEVVTQLWSMTKYSTSTVRLSS